MLADFLQAMPTSFDRRRTILYLQTTFLPIFFYFVTVYLVKIFKMIVQIKLIEERQQRQMSRQRQQKNNK